MSDPTTATISGGGDFFEAAIAEVVSPVENEAERGITIFATRPPVNRASDQAIKKKAPPLVARVPGGGDPVSKIPLELLHYFFYNDGVSGPRGHCDGRLVKVV
jgi:hypothetical protein